MNTAPRDSVPPTDPTPVIANIGLTGLLVNFADHLSEPANRAALALRARVDAENGPGVVETSTALTSMFVGFDPVETDHAKLASRLKALLGCENWHHSALPARKSPVVAHPDSTRRPGGPATGRSRRSGGLTPKAAVEQLTRQQVRVLTIGFAPGQPYLGILPPEWDIPRQTQLTRQLPIGALTVAVRQLVLFTAATPTGWRHVGQTAFRGFRPHCDTPFALRPGDEVIFTEVATEELANIKTRDISGNGGAVWQDLP